MKTKNIRRGICMVATALLALATHADITHTVKKGESLGGIAYKYNISVSELVKHNPKAAQGLRTGMTLTIPDGSSSSYTDPEAQEPKPAPVESAPVQKESPKPVEKENKPMEKESKAAKAEADSESSALGTIYSSKKGETLESISRKFDIPLRELIDLNPFIEPNDIPVGSIIRLTDSAPIVEYVSHDQIPSRKDAPSPVENATPVLNDAVENGSEREEVVFNDAVEEEEDVFVDRVPQQNTIMVLLPFMANEEHQSKNSERFGDFYRGFLMAANDRKDNGEYHVVVRTYDTHDNAYRLDSLLRSQIDENVAIIVAPEEENHLRLVSDFCAPRGIYVANFFNVRDESYESNPYMLQTYINQPLMYEKGISALLNNFEGYTPVVLMPDGAKMEKEPFVTALRQRCAEDGISVIDLPFDDNLTLAKIEENPNIKPDGKYVFLPMSGSPSVFNRFAPALIEYKQKSGDVGVFGYPDWTAFHSENRESLEELQALVYTRFYYDPDCYEARRLQGEFEEWYGEPINDGTPNLAVLGYDAGNCLLLWMQESEGRIANMIEGDETYRGIQSTFRFDHAGKYDGFVNTALYIVKFLPGKNTIITVL